MCLGLLFLWHNHSPKFLSCVFCSFCWPQKSLCILICTTSSVIWLLVCTATFPSSSSKAIGHHWIDSKHIFVWKMNCFNDIMWGEVVEYQVIPSQKSKWSQVIHTFPLLWTGEVTSRWCPSPVASLLEFVKSIWFITQIQVLWLESTPLQFTLYKHRLFLFSSVFYEKTTLCMKTKAPKYIFAYIIHRLQIVWNQTKSKTFNSCSVKRNLTRLVHILFCSLHFHWINTVHPPKHKTTFKKSQTFYFLSVISP